MILAVQLSIHPRNHGTIKHAKRNTRGSKNKALVEAKIERMEEHLAQHPMDNATREHIKKLMELL